MVSKLRDICDRHSTPDDISITVFHPWFIYIDQYLAILPQTIQVRRNKLNFMYICCIYGHPTFLCFDVFLSLVHHRDCCSYGRHRSNTHTVTHLLLLGLLLNSVHRGKN